MIIKSKQEYQKEYTESIEHPEKFWAKIAAENLHFFQNWTSVFSKDEEDHIRWFDGGLLNVSYHCLDRHLTNGNKEKHALIWESEDGETQKFTYLELYILVCRFAAALEKLGVQTGDRVVIYLPLIPEAVIAMLACARIGAPHTVVFAGFSADSLADRINDCGAKILITADGGLRKGSVVPLKTVADEASAHAPSLENIVVVNRFKNKKSAIPMTPKRDIFWDELMQNNNLDQQSDDDKVHYFEAKPLPSEHPLFILYTSGTTGKPKGVVHTTAGYLLGAHFSTQQIFNFTPTDVFWSTADVGWITGHTYIVYGPLSNGGTIFIYEGALMHPDPGRFWELVEKHKVSILYTAPTAIRMCVKYGREWPDKYNLSSLRLLGTLGEPISPDTWKWYEEVIGGNRCPVLDTWWQTETGSVMITSIPNVINGKPGSASFPFFGIDAVILDDDGHEVKNNQIGFLCIRKPWPSIARTIYGDHERYRQGYWNKIEGVYFTGDGAYRDDDGYFWITGRIDDVLNVSGHRLSTVEIENAILSNPDVAECAVVGIADDIKGQMPVAFVMLKSGINSSSELKKEIQHNIEVSIGHFAKTDLIHFVPGFPKTRSGKMMRRLLREFAQTGKIESDVTTLEDMSILNSFVLPDAPKK